jgi:hypothetical protein
MMCASQQSCGSEATSCRASPLLSAAVCAHLATVVRVVVTVAKTSAASLKSALAADAA